MKTNYKLLWLLLCGLMLPLFMTSCQEQEESYEERISNCLENAKGIEFEIPESDKKGMNHFAEPECLLGVRLPDFETKDIEGNTINTTNIKGKINVMNFWFIKCAPCIAEIPYLNTLVGKYDPDKVNFLAFAKDSSSQVQSFLKQRPFDFRIIPDETGIIENDFQLGWGYPFTIITDKENIIIGAIEAHSAKEFSPEAIIDKIESILKQEGL